MPSCHLLGAPVSTNLRSQAEVALPKSGVGLSSLLGEPLKALATDSLSLCSPDLSARGPMPCRKPRTDCSVALTRLCRCAMARSVCPGVAAARVAAAALLLLVASSVTPAALSLDPHLHGNQDFR